MFKCCCLKPAWFIQKHSCVASLWVCLSFSYSINIELTEFIILESGGIFLGWLGIIYNSFLLIVGSLSNYMYKKMEEESIENQNRRLLKALSEGSYGGYGDYGRRGYRNVRSISDDNFIEKAIFIAKLHVLLLTILCYVMVILRLTASIILLIGTKKVS